MKKADIIKCLKAKLTAAVKKANSAMNKYYPLANKTTNIKDTQKKKLDLNKIATNIAKAVYKADTTILLILSHLLDLAPAFA